MPAKRGNKTAVKSGTGSERMLAPVREAHARDLRQRYPEGVPPSTEAPDRIVPLPEALRAELTEHLAALPGGTPNSLVFQAQGTANAQQRAANPKRAIHQVAWMRNHFKPAVKKALPAYANYTDKKVQSLRAHDLRHTYASLLIGRGAHLEAVRVLLGHASIVTTQRYAHLAPDVYVSLTAGLGAAPAAPAEDNVVALTAN